MTWTDNERDMLRAVHHYLGHVIANPTHGIEHLRSGHGSGGGGGFGYEFGSNSIRGEWREWVPVQWRPGGSVCRWRSGDLLRTATVSYARLETWAQSLPAEVRERAAVHWRTHPEWTRNLAALDRLTLAVIDGDFYPKPSTVPTPAGDQYTLDSLLEAR